MSKTLVRGLDLIEEVGMHGPVTVSELARRSGIHVSIVSRTVSALEPQGWLRRVDGKIVAGPRCTLLGLIGPAGQTVRRADQFVRAIAAITGVATMASGLVGRDAMITAAAPGADGELLDGVAIRVPLFVMAASRAIAAQLSEETLDALLPDPFPTAEQAVAAMALPMPAHIGPAEPATEPGAGVPRDRAELDADLARIRADGFARDRGELHPAFHCIAIPWPALDLPSSIACIGTREAIATNAALIESCLRAAVKPGAGVQDIVPRGD
jgi:DNA-binding IclR family transcriptional regulator